MPLQGECVGVDASNSLVTFFSNENEKKQTENRRNVGRRTFRSGCDGSGSCDEAEHHTGRHLVDSYLSSYLS